MLLEGRLTADPELRTTPSGKQVADFTIAVSERRFNQQANQWENGGQYFARCTAWETLAANVTASLHKGDPVVARVRPYLEKYIGRDGEDRTAIRHRVETVAVSLDWCTVTVSRTPAQSTVAGGGHSSQQVWPETPINSFNNEEPF